MKQERLAKIQLFVAVFLGVLGQACGQITLVNVSNTNNGGYAYGITVSNNYAYLANGSDGLRIYDITNPRTPINIGHANPNNGNWDQSVAISGTYAYVAGTYDGLRIYDIADRTNPINVGQTNKQTGGAIDVAVSGHYAYVANHEDGLRIYDVSNPASPLVMPDGRLRSRVVTDPGVVAAAVSADNRNPMSKAAKAWARRAAMPSRAGPKCS